MIIWYFVDYFIINNMNYSNSHYFNIMYETYRSILWYLFIYFWFYTTNKTYIYQIINSEKSQHAKQGIHTQLHRHTKGNSFKLKELKGNHSKNSKEFKALKALQSTKSL